MCRVNGLYHSLFISLSLLFTYCFAAPFCPGFCRWSCGWKERDPMSMVVISKGTSGWWFLMWLYFVGFFFFLSTFVCPVFPFCFFCILNHILCAVFASLCVARRLSVWCGIPFHFYIRTLCFPVSFRVCFGAETSPFLSVFFPPFLPLFVVSYRCFWFSFGALSILSHHSCTGRWSFVLGGKRRMLRKKECIGYASWMLLWFVVLRVDFLSACSPLFFSLLV